MRAENGTCTAASYDVLLRNFDPITWQPTAYVNGTYYSYRIVDNCTVADALEDANGELGAGLSTTTAAVATQESLQLGGFYLGLTRDDFGGLRYLYNRQNYAIESLPTGCLVGLPTTGSPWAPVTTNSSGGATSGSPWTPVSTNANSFSNTFAGGILGGVDKIIFVKVAADSLIGDTWPSNVMTFSIPLLTNYTVEQLPVMRSNSAPDILFTAGDLLVAGADQPYTRTHGAAIASPAAAPNADAVLPGVFSPTMTVILNNVGPIYVNITTSFLQDSAFFLYPYFQFGSFDGSTNAPIAFPSGTSLAALLALETTPPSGLNTTSPYNPLLQPTNTTAAGTGAGTVTTGTGTGGATTGGATGTTTGGGTGAGTGGAAARALPAGGNVP